MEDKNQKIIQFDILLKPAGSPGAPNVENIEKLRPDPENIEKCRRWLASRDVTCHSTDFGLACTASVEVFELVFSTKVKPGGLGAGMPRWSCSPPPRSPCEIDEYIDQISIPAPPELF